MAAKKASISMWIIFLDVSLISGKMSTYSLLGFIFMHEFIISQSSFFTPNPDLYTSSPPPSLFPISWLIFFKKP